MINVSRSRGIIGASGQCKHKPDYLIPVLATILLLIGLIVVYAISPGLSVQQNVGENYFVTKQLMAIGLGLVTFIMCSFMDLKLWNKISKGLIIAAAVASVAVLFFGQEVLGATRWIQIGGLSFQAVELIKFALLIWASGFLAKAAARRDTLGDWNKTLKPLLVAIVVSAVVVAGLQSDLGSAAVIVAMLTAMAFVAGVPFKKILVVCGIILIGAILAIAASPYRRERVSTFLDPSKDCLGSGYQACNAFLAIGSGGMFGKGVNRGVSAYGYVPEAANDSIFAIYSEMFGFVGSVTLLGIFATLFYRIKRIAERSNDPYTLLLITGILAWLSAQALINIGAMTGLLPVKGITLPFISYGGTSIIFTTAIIGLVFRASKYTALSPLRSLNAKGDSSHEPGSMRGRQRRPHYAQLSRR